MSHELSIKAVSSGHRWIEEHIDPTRQSHLHTSKHVQGLKEWTFLFNIEHLQLLILQSTNSGRENGVLHDELNMWTYYELNRNFSLDTSDSQFLSKERLHWLLKFLGYTTYITSENSLILLTCRCHSISYYQQRMQNLQCKVHGSVAKNCRQIFSHHLRLASFLPLKPVK